MLARKKIFSSMKKCEISRYSFSYTGVIDCTMGGQKLLFYRKKSKNQQTALVVSIPISLYLSRQTTPESLHSLVAESLPEQWTIAVKNPLTIVKLRVQHTCDSPKVDVIITLCVQHQLTWTLSVLNVSLDPSLNPAFKCFNSTLSGAPAVVSLLRAIDSLSCCVGNPDLKFLDLWKHRSSTLHGSSGNFSHKNCASVMLFFVC